jgi:hypothetical protein
MLNELDAKTGLAAKSALSWPSIWWTAATRPTRAAYQALAENAGIRPRHAVGWLVGSSLIGGLLIASTAFFRDFAPRSAANLALGVLVFALAHAALYLIFAGCAHGVARLWRGQGDYAALVKVAAAFNVPLVLLAGILAFIPRGGVLMLGLYLYWLLLFWVAIQAVYQISRAKAITAVLIALLLLGGAVLGAGYLLVL